MNVIQCTKCKKHYDADKFPSCPHCEDGIDAIMQKESDAEITKKSKRSFFGKKEKRNNDDFGDVTLGMYSSSYYKDPSDNSEETDDPKKSSASEEDKDISNNPLEEQNNPVKLDGQDDPVDPEPSPDISLTQEIKNITKNNSGRTLGYFSLGNSDESTKSSSDVASAAVSNPALNKSQSAPVVGWLVCTKGKHLGESFQIYDGNNSIGRSDSNDVVLFKEQSVSSNKHAIIIYEPRKRNFLIQPGSSHGLTYLNDDLVTTPQKIEIYDSIEFGESAFIFIPLCGDQFSWEKYIGR